MTGVFSEEATEDEDGINAVDEAGVNAVVVVEESEYMSTVLDD